MGKFFWGLILSSMFQLLAEETHAPKASKLVTKAPETLDLSQVQSWITGSIWALLSLNLIALAIFLINALYPHWRRLIAFVRSLLRRKQIPQPTLAPSPIAAAVSAPAELKAAETISTASSAKVTPSPIPDPGPAIVPLPVTSFAAPKSAPPAAPSPESAAPPAASQEVVEEFDLPKFDDAPPSPPPEPQPQVVAEAAPELAPSPPQPSPIDPPPAAEAPAESMMADETTKISFNRTEELSAVTDELPKSNSLPETLLSDEKVNAPMPAAAESLKSIEETLNEALTSGLDTTEELSIFDPSIIDDVLREDQKK